MKRDLERSQMAMAEHPGRLEAVYRHIRNPDKAQRETEAVGSARAALAKLDADPQAFTDGDKYRRWMLNHLGYILYELGEPEEGAAALAMLAQTGSASAYGRAWIESLRSCGGVLIGDEELRSQGIAYLEAHVADNPPALSRALLCSNDVDGAAALMIRRLGNRDWRSGAIMALQRAPGTALNALPFQKLLADRFDLLREREDVLQALAPVGRIETMPLDIGGGN